MKALQAKIRYLEQENQQLRASSGNMFIDNKSTIWNQEPDENITLRIT
jgi:hypothetical protein